MSFNGAARPTPSRGRNEDVQLIYTTPDSLRAQNLLVRYDVEYVYVGPRERAQYGEEGLKKFAEFMVEDFREGDVVIYRMPSAPQ